MNARELTDAELFWPGECNSVRLGFVFSGKRCPVRWMPKRKSCPAAACSPLNNLLGMRFDPGGGNNNRTPIEMRVNGSQFTCSHLLRTLPDSLTTEVRPGLRY